MSTKSPPETTDVPVTPASFRVARERLGLTSARLAEILGVAGRNVQKWERGEGAGIPAARVAQLHELEQRTRTAVDQIARDLRAEARAARRPPTVTTYENDAQYQQHDGGPWSASWHRAVVARAVEIYDRPVIIEYPTVKD